MLRQVKWTRREIENYFASESVLLSWAQSAAERLAGPLFIETWERHMSETIKEVESALRVLGKDPWSHQTKVTDDVLDPVFRAFFERLGLPILFGKSDYHELAEAVDPDALDPEVFHVLDALADVAERAKTAKDA